MMRPRYLYCMLTVALLAGCTVKENEDAQGNKTYDVDPAKVKVSTDSVTVKVPDIDIVTDSAADTTTSR